MKMKEKRDYQTESGGVMEKLEGGKGEGKVI